MLGSFEPILESFVPASESTVPEFDALELVMLEFTVTTLELVVLPLDPAKLDDVDVVSVSSPHEQISISVMMRSKDKIKSFFILFNKTSDER